MKYSIRKLRIIALLLFLIPTLALVGSLFIHNYLVSFKYVHEVDYGFQENLPGNKIKIQCLEENNYCSGIKFINHTKLGNCYSNYISSYFVDENDKFLKNIDAKKSNLASQVKDHPAKKIFYIFEITNELNPACIVNSQSWASYNLFPSFYENIIKIKNNKLTDLGTSETVNPFLYGETSISNIVKRYPLKFFFKPLLYLTVILMLSYWIYYNNIFKNITGIKKNYFFFKFGILSAIFLFLHVLFLGWEFESDFLTKLRRTFVIFFIFFEVIAQVLLIRKILFIKNLLLNYINSLIVYLKLIFVFIISFLTLIILVILVMYDLNSRVDFILEWNYFLVLLFFYFLSSLMWKKN